MNGPEKESKRWVYEVSAACNSCDACLQPCPSHCIYYGRGQVVIDTDECIDCGICAQVCPQHAIQRIQIS